MEKDRADKWVAKRLLDALTRELLRIRRNAGEATGVRPDADPFSASPDTRQFMLKVDGIVWRPDLIDDLQSAVHRVVVSQE